MFYTFHQNNSFGAWDGPLQICIEADSAKEANQIAEAETVIYFNGVIDDRDCDCCGDRWSPVYDDDGHSIPKSYGEPAEASEDFLIVYKKKEEKTVQIKKPTFETPTKEEWISDVVDQKTTESFEVWKKQKIRIIKKSYWVNEVNSGNTELGFKDWLLESNATDYW